MKGCHTNEFKRVSFFSSTSQKIQNESCCISLATSVRSLGISLSIYICLYVYISFSLSLSHSLLDLECADPSRSLDFFRAFKWLLQYNAQLKAIEEVYIYIYILFLFL